MKKYLISNDGNFYKANLHCHTTISDGRKTPEQVKEIYKARGYSIVAFTDHEVLIDQQALKDDSFLPLNGYEIAVEEVAPLHWRELKCCHICLIALKPDNLLQPFWHRTKYLYHNSVNHRDKVLFDKDAPDYERDYSVECISQIMQGARDRGFYVTYNHPSWSGETYEYYTKFSGMHAFEMYNGGSSLGGYEDYNPRVYDDFLINGKKIFCVGGDDNHNAYPETSRKFDSGVAFTMIKAKSLSYSDVADSLLSGNFYASEGPEIYELYYEDSKVHIKCSNADKISLKCAIRYADCVYSEDGKPLTEATFKIEPNFKYFRITVTDKAGKTACTNAYFLEDIL